MKRYLIALLLVCTVTAMAQTADPLAGKKLNWLERRYRKTNIDRVATAESRLAEARDDLDKRIAAPESPDQQRDIFVQKSDLAVYQKELDEARIHLTKADELLAKALGDKGVRKQFNKELRVALQEENRQTAAKYSSYPSMRRNFRVDCYSGGYGRHFWVRCTSYWY